MLVNLLPGQILQPFVDSAFKKRGIDPEKFWRNAGLPAFRFPDPNAQRFPNGAPHRRRPCSKARPSIPVPAVLKGSPCSYTPPADVLPRPGDPLPCSHLSVGPFGQPVRPRLRAAGRGRPRTRTRHGPGFTPGVPSRGHPGSAAAGHARRAGPAAACSSGCTHSAGGSAPARGAGLHTRHRAIAARPDGSAAATRARPGRGACRYTAVAGQSAVPPARIAGGAE